MRISEKLEHFKAQLKYVKLRDICAFGYFFVALPISFMFRLKHPHLWLICEDENEARDNGYWFFKYVTAEHPEQEVAYAINKKSPDYKKVNDLGKVISYGTMMHWIYYLAAEKNISSQKGGKPNAAVCYFLEVYDIWKNCRIFLQHGVIINDCKWLYREVSRFSLFICATFPEYQYIKERFGYKECELALTGLARYDGLHNIIVRKNRILIMPTWRQWLRRITAKSYELDNVGNFTNTEYYQCWNGFINCKELASLIQQYNLEVIFYPHRNMQPYLKEFHVNESLIKLADWKKYEIQDLLKSSCLMITDYSSVFFDFVYMRKPVIFYQFDEYKFRENQYGNGYFDYFNNPFAKAFTSSLDVICELENIIQKDFEVDKEYYEEHKKIFKYNDKMNCQRIYKAIRKEQS